MGLLRAGQAAVTTVFSDSWRDYFYCDAIAADVLAVKGCKRVSSKSSNTKASDNLISNGSIVCVADGQCMMIVEQGKVVELSAEPGEFVFDTSTEPSIFYGGLNKENILASLQTIGKRFTFGGDTAKDQRVYYFNTKEIIGNKYGTANPVPFRVVDRNIGLDIDISVRCNGEYSYKIVDPVSFYANVCGNVTGEYRRSEIDSQLKSELLGALQPAFAKISEMGIRYSALPGHTTEITEALNEVLSKLWTEKRGLAVYSFGMNSVTASEEDQQMIKELQKKAVYRDPGMGAANLNDAQAEAMKAAASNENGAMMGFMGMGFAQTAGGMNSQNLYNMAAQQNQQAQQPQQPAPAADGWKCECGSVNNGNFCMNCGKAKPAPAQGWTCACGAVNQGKFCSNCGKPKPAGAPLYKCDKCGWTPEDPHNPPKFCPECGDIFDDNDAK